MSVPSSLSGIARRSLCRTIYGMLERGQPVQGVATFAQPNDELQRTSDGTAAGSPLNSVFGGPDALRRCDLRNARMNRHRLVMKRVP